MSRTRNKSRDTRFTLRDQIRRRVRVGFLSALGYLLRRLGRFQPYPLLPFLELEVSDAVVRVAYSLYGFFASAFVAIVKTLLSRLTWGPVGAPIPIGNRTAVFTSLRYSFRLLFCDKVFHLFDKKLWKRIIGYIIVILGVSARRTFLNWWFITPVYRTFGAQWMDYFQIRNSLSNLESDIGATFHQYFGRFNAGYTASIILAYGPFNLLKGFLVCAAYELICNRVIFHVLKSNKMKINWFKKSSDFKETNFKEKSDNTSLPNANENESDKSRK